MARNDVVLLDSIVAKSREQLGEKLEPSELFELFSFDQMLKDYDPTFDELQDGWTDGGNDGGIDGFFVILDDIFATSDFEEFASRRQPRVHLRIFSVRTAPKFEQQPLDSIYGSLKELLDLGLKEAELKYPYNDCVLRQRRLFSDIYVSLADRRPQLTIWIHYCARGSADRIAPNLLGRSRSIEKMLKGLFSNATVIFEFVGAAELLNQARKQKDFTLRLPYIENFVSRQGRDYLILCALSDYFNFVVDEEGKLRRYLFESNVRDYLGSTQINLDITQTLSSARTEESDDFWWLNNGVTILGTGASVAGKELCIENVQIVNGLQTTETIYRYFSQHPIDNEGRAILVKIILAVDDNSRARIIKATNYQNSVDLASSRGLDKIQRDIEHILQDHGWYYDRRRNYYKNEARPAERIISVPYVASAVRAIALGDPPSERRQRSRSLRKDQLYNTVFNPEWDLHVFVACVRISRAIENALHMRRGMWEAPVALVHHIGFVYACEQLGKYPYRPDDVAPLWDKPPTPEDVGRIKAELTAMSSTFKGKGRVYEGVNLSRKFIIGFAAMKFNSARCGKRKMVSEKG